jgi:hypothetical protein
MFTQMEVTVLSDFEGQQVLDVKVSNIGERPAVCLSLIGNFKGRDTTPDEAFSMGMVLDALRDTVNSARMYKGALALPSCLRDLSSQDDFPSMILIENSLHHVSLYDTRF